MEVVDEGESRAREEREIECDVEPVDMEERKHAEADIVAVETQSGMRLHLFQVGAQRTVRQHRRLRRSGGTRCEEQDGDVVVRARDRLELFGCFLRAVQHEHGLRRVVLRNRAPRQVGVGR
jgi:hypothetical protein